MAFGRRIATAGAGAVCAVVLTSPAAHAAAPSASFTVSPSAPRSDGAVTLTSTSTDMDGDAMSEAWLFDGDDVVDATGPVVTHTFAAGTYTVRLMVTDAAGASGATSESFAVVDPPPPPLAPPPPPPPPPPANVAPVAAFGSSPNGPVVGQSVAFTSRSTDSDGTIASQLWDLDGDGQFDDAAGGSPRWAYSAFGTVNVGLLVRDDAGAEATARRAVIVNQPPSASFSLAPSRIVVGDPVTFTSTSGDVDGRIVRQTWDLDGDGRFGDSTAGSAQQRYTAPGVVVVRLQVTDDRGATATASGLVTVMADVAPVAAFAFSPVAPLAGQAVTFASRSTDADGTIAALAWDLNGDGLFQDAAGPAATGVFPRAGSYMVTLRATDDRGVSSVAFQTVAVSGTVSPQDALAAPQLGTSAAVPYPPGSSPSPGARLMSPFPVVHIRGRIFGDRVKIDVLSVRAPRGAIVRVRCSGRTRGCPRPSTATARASSSRRPLRVRALERRYRPGAVIEVFVTTRGRVGKYVRFTIRRGGAPVRRDLCVSASANRPSACPSG